MILTAAQRRAVLTMSEVMIDNSEGRGEQLSEKELKKLEKEAFKARRNEIKHILLGNFKLSDKGRLAAGSGRWVTPFGIGDGAGNAIVYGISEMSLYYKTKLKNNRQAVFQAQKAMADIGRGLILDTAPDSAVCYVKSVVFRPVVLVFEEKEGADGSSLLLTAYSSRSPIAFVALLRAVTRFDKALPEDIERDSTR